MTEGSGKRVMCPACSYVTRVFDEKVHWCPHCAKDDDPHAERLWTVAQANAIAEDRRLQADELRGEQLLATGTDTLLFAFGLIDDVTVFEDIGDPYHAATLDLSVPHTYHDELEELVDELDDAGEMYDRV